MQALSARHHELAPLFSCKRLFVQRKSMNTYKIRHRRRLRRRGTRAEARRYWFGEAFSELAFSRHVAEWQKDEAANADKLDTALRYAAWAVHTPAGQQQAPGRRAVQGAEETRLSDIWCRSTRMTENGVTVHTLSHLRRRHGFALTDSGTDLVGALDQTNYCIWCHEQGRDSCSHGLKEKAPADGGAAPFKKTVFGVPLAGCPLEERISEFQKLKSRRYRGRRAGDDHGGQPDGRSHRAPHLQRLHEILHLPEAGAGQHPAGGNPQPEGRAGTALGFRDLQPAHALEPARSAPAVPQARKRPPRAGRRHGPGRIHRGASSDERRPQRGRHRRPEDRTAARARVAEWIARGARVAFEPIYDVRIAVRIAGRSRHGRLRRRGRVRHYGALGQEFPQAHPAAAATAAGIRVVRRGALRRHAFGRRRL